MVDLVGIEPTTSSMPWKRAPSCATGPLSEENARCERLNYSLPQEYLRQREVAAFGEASMRDGFGLTYCRRSPVRIQQWSARQFLTALSQSKACSLPSRLRQRYRDESTGYRQQTPSGTSRQKLRRPSGYRHSSCRRCLT